VHVDKLKPFLGTPPNTWHAVGAELNLDIARSPANNTHTLHETGHIDAGRVSIPHPDGTNYAELTAVVDDLRDEDGNALNCDDGEDVPRAKNQRPRRRHRRPGWFTNYVCGVSADSGYTASGTPVMDAVPRGTERPPVLDATAEGIGRPQQVVKKRSKAVMGDATKGAASGEGEGRTECPLCHKSFARGGWALTRHLNAYGWTTASSRGQECVQLRMRDLRKMSAQEYDRFRGQRTHDARPTLPVIQLWLDQSVPEPRDHPALPCCPGRARVASYAPWTAQMNASSNKKGAGRHRVAGIVVHRPGHHAPTNGSKL
jgi:hypothetical protein